MIFIALIDYYMFMSEHICLFNTVSVCLRGYDVCCVCVLGWVYEQAVSRPVLHQYYMHGERANLRTYSPNSLPSV